MLCPWSFCSTRPRINFLRSSRRPFLPAPPSRLCLITATPSSFGGIFHVHCWSMVSAFLSTVGVQRVRGGLAGTIHVVGDSIFITCVGLLRSTGIALHDFAVDVRRSNPRDEDFSNCLCESRDQLVRSLKGLVTEGVASVAALRQPARHLYSIVPRLRKQCVKFVVWSKFAWVGSGQKKRHLRFCAFVCCQTCAGSGGQRLQSARDRRPRIQGLRSD